MSAPSYGANGTYLQGSAGTAQVAVPASVVSGSIVVVYMYLDAAFTITALPSGFAHAANSPIVNPGGGGGTGAHSLNIMWKRASGNDTGTYDFTLSGSAFRAAVCIRYDGCVASGDPWDFTNTAFVTTTGSNARPNVSGTTLGADRLLVYSATDWTGGAWTPPTSFNERLDTGFQVHTVDDLVQAVAGGTGNVAATCAAADRACAFLGALIGTTGGGGGAAMVIQPMRARRVTIPLRIARERVTSQVASQQVVPPPNEMDQPRRIRGLLARRGRRLTPVRPQLNPPYPVFEEVQPRRPRGWLFRRGDRVTPVPPQFNPPFPWNEDAQPRRLRGALPRRGRTATPVPAQITFTPPPYQPESLRVRVKPALLRRGRVFQIVPAQIVLTAPAFVPQPSQPRRLSRYPTVRCVRRRTLVPAQLSVLGSPIARRRSILLARRGSIVSPTLTQELVVVPVTYAEMQWAERPLATAIGAVGSGASAQWAERSVAQMGG